MSPLVLRNRHTQLLSNLYNNNYMPQTENMRQLFELCSIAFVYTPSVCTIDRHKSMYYIQRAIEKDFTELYIQYRCSIIGNSVINRMHNIKLLLKNIYLFATYVNFAFILIVFSRTWYSI